ncbi:EKC KEOPS complex subunit Gon7 [Fusarium beomiforme]|uniref:EKC/KEOPS complex subunit GON7 n=1 Tax=Fusarium beomiforme TaxID=44412 RepID=A0A9P5AC30_9HYPO|nr:EKC KEOPS complex subunit Gon7 [Fusarium beomiforme]
MSQPTLTADYISPTSEPFKVSHALPTISSTASTADKSSYLKALRASVADTQATINEQLTARMEQDKARDAAAEAREEENYGEEVQEEED